MGVMFRALTGSVTSVLGGVWGYVAAAAISAAIAGYGAWSIKGAFDDRAVAAMRLADAQSATLAAQVAMKVNTDVSQLGVDVESRLLDLSAYNTRLTARQTTEVYHYVTREMDRTVRLPCGYLRVHDAAVLGVDPSTLASAACSSDAAVAPVAASDVVANDVANYGVCHQYEDQNAALRAYVRGLTALWDKVAAAPGK